MSIFTSYTHLLKKFIDPKDRVSLNVLCMVAISKSKNPSDLSEVKRAINTLESDSQYVKSIEVLKEELLKKNREVFAPLFECEVEESIISPVLYFYNLVEKEIYFKRNSILFTKEACSKRDELFSFTNIKEKEEEKEENKEEEKSEEEEIFIADSQDFLSSNDSFTVEPLSKKVKSINLIDELYSGIQCIHCGLRFKEGDIAYSEHINSHARLLRAGKHTERQVFPPENKWHQIKNIVNIPHIKIKESKLYSNKNTVICEVCKEKMDVEWDSNKDKWIVNNGVSIEGFITHRKCIE